MKNDDMDSRIKIALFIFSWIFTLSGFFISRILSEADVRMLRLENEAQESIKARAGFLPQIERNNSRIDSLEQWRIHHVQEVSIFIASAGKVHEYIHQKLELLERECKKK